MPVERTGKKVSPIGETFDDEDLEDFGDVFSDVPLMVTVQTPGGASLPVMNQLEADQYNKIATEYQSDNMFKNISDKLELDRILTLEIMCFRWSTWLLQERDYDGGKVNVTELQKNLDTHSKGILALKTGLAIDKKNRDASAKGSTADYISKLQLRAKEMGIHRDEQNYKAFNIMKELQGKITLYENSTETERTEFEVHLAQIHEWIKSKFEELDELDKHFRVNQKIWVRELQE